ncbi:MAG: hypothetical protein JWQ27_926 [Ferruginibacter sp.]|nr:hypothetical protein [Ferruginibacter sp.]
MRILLLLFIGLQLSAVAQPIESLTKIIVTDANKNLLENVTITLHRATDSVLVRTAITGKDGVAEFQRLRAGNYFAKASLLDYEQTVSAVFAQAENNQAIKIMMKDSGKQLGTVTVTARKPFIQKLSDRIVVNVDNSILSSGSSAMEILEKSPGVNIDQNDLVSLRGKSGVIIMIDGKPTAMTGSDLANYLRSLPSAALERIDIITNPSAKYDAAGNSGIIDIRMKKDQRLGVNGTFNIGYGQGVYPKFNTGAGFNYRNKKVNMFGSYNYAYRVGLNHLFLDRNFYEDGIYNGGDLKDNYSKSPVNSHTGRLGIDFFPSAKTIVGFVLNTNFNHYTRKNDNRSIVVDPNSMPTSTFASFAGNNDHGKNMVANINFKHRFDSAGRELTADLDYGAYRSASLTFNTTQYYRLDGSMLKPSYTLNGDQDGRLNFKTVKVDYVNPLGKGSRWEAGFKTSFVSSDNDALFTDVSTGSPQNDVNKTNHFLYKENNNAAYINFFTTYKKFDLQFGLRGEQTNISTEQKIGNVKFDSGYVKLFPTAFINYKLGDEKTVGFSVSKRIDRPGYSQLNPFLFLIDVTTYSTGRPGLLPQFTWAYEMSYTVKSYNFSLSYSHTRNDQNIAIARFSEVFPNIATVADSNVTVQIPVNLSSSDYVGLSISAPMKISKWWTMLTNADIYFQQFNGQLGTTNLSNGKPAADIRVSNNFNFKRGWSAELNANFNSGGQYGFMVSEPQWGLGAGTQKTILKNKGTLRFNISDIFWTNLPKAVITYDNYIEKWHAYRESRVANLSFSYRFGNNKVQAARKRTTASEEERQRAQ